MRGGVRVGVIKQQTVFVVDWGQTRFGPISVHHPEFIIHNSLFTNLRYQLSVVSRQFRAVTSPRAQSSAMARGS
jgi:hypothetical protein